MAKNITMKELQKMSRDELLELNEMVVNAIKLIDSNEASEKISEFSVGDAVVINSKKGKLKGKITKKNRKTFIVQCHTANYKVHASLIEHDK